MTVPCDKIRNIAVIAHIDHGKTTLLDSLLGQANIFQAHEKIPERVMDSYDQERERGITIFAKHTSVYYKEHKINIIDTPGHADFSGEVERVLGMVGSVLLVVDAKEGPMPQTRFVLTKALQLGLCPIVVINKIDRPHADPDRVVNETFDLFVELGATDEQLDFEIAYTSALHGYAMRDIDAPRENMRPLFDLILEAVPAPQGNIDEPFLMQVSTVTYDDFLGRQGCGRILRGEIKKGNTLVLVSKTGRQSVKISRIQGHLGIKQVELERAGVGDIVSLAGSDDVMIGDTFASSERVEALDPIEIEPPTVSIDIMVNNSPFAGRDGDHVTMNKVRDRLEHEKRANITYEIDTEDQDAMTVSGRGELHLSILLEAMRREGYEMSISKPRVIIKEEDGKKLEPIERVHVEVPKEYSGPVIEELAKRKGEMLNLQTDEHGITKLEYLMPTRGLMGYRNEFLTVTRGKGIMTSIFDRFAPWKGEMPGRGRGALIAIGPGKATGYSLFNLQPRGTLFVGPGDDVYEGMVVGEHNRENDLVVNVVKGKQLTNVRASGTDENVVLTPPRSFNIEQAIDYIESDELVELTPNYLRLRKRILLGQDRKRKGR